MHRIVVCSTCEGTDGKGFAARLRAAFSERGMEFTVQDHDCMSNCGRPLSVAFSAAGKAKCADGWIEDARPAGRLRHCLIGRVPG